MTIDLADPGLAALEPRAPALLAGEGAALFLEQAARLAESAAQGRSAPTLQQALAQAGGCGCGGRGPEPILDLAPPLGLAELDIPREPERAYSRVTDHLGDRGSALWLLHAEAPLPLAFEPEAPAPAPTKDVSLRAASTEEEAIIVEGKRLEEEDEPSMPGSTNEGGDPTLGGGDTGMGGGGYGEPTTEEQNDCRDRKALEAQNDIRNEPDNNVDEHASVIYKDPSGAVRHSPPIEGDEFGIPLDAILTWMRANGVSMSQVIGLVHNHPAYEYGNAPELNRYPSGGAVPGGDWAAAEWMVGQGAGGPNGQDFALYVMDTGGTMREFEYSNRDAFKSLNKDERERGVNLPDPVQGDGSNCA